MLCPSNTRVHRNTRDLNMNKYRKLQYVRMNVAVLVSDAMIYSPWNHLRHGQHALYRYLKKSQLVSKAVIHAKTVSKPSILTQRDELQRCVYAWGLDNSQALFIACSNDVYLFQWETYFRIRTMPWSIFNRVHIKHMVSGAVKGL